MLFLLEKSPCGHGTISTTLVKYIHFYVCDIKIYIFTTYTFVFVANSAYICNICSEHLCSISVFAIRGILHLQYIIGAFIPYFCICNTQILYLQYMYYLKLRFYRRGLCVLVVGERRKFIVLGMKWVVVARNELILWENGATGPKIILKYVPDVPEVQN